MGNFDHFFFAYFRTQSISIYDAWGVFGAGLRLLTAPVLILDFEI
jgi:hypothetical protein